MGSTKYLSLVRERKEHFKQLRIGLTEVAIKFGLRILETPGNSISIGNLDAWLHTKHTVLSV